MECKNCQRKLRTDYGFCPACGAKVIRNRLTVKNLWYDAIERYFNLDNTFIKTFLHLFTQPQTVIEGYIHGIRRKYLNPISYMGIAITLSGFLVLLMRKNGASMDMDVWGTGTSSVAQGKVMDRILDFQGLLFILYIPMMAIAAWLCFQNKKHNFSERMVIFMYTMAHYSLIIFIPSVIILAFSPSSYMIFSLISLLFMYLYSAYVIKKIAQERGLELWPKVLVFWIVFTIFYMSLSIILPIILLLTGDIQLEDFLPKKT